MPADIAVMPRRERPRPGQSLRRRCQADNDCSTHRKPLRLQYPPFLSSVAGAFDALDPNAERPGLLRFHLAARVVLGGIKAAALKAALPPTSPRRVTLRRSICRIEILSFGRATSFEYPYG